MSLLWNWLDEGRSAPSRATRRQRLVYWFGRRLALSRGGVEIHPTALVHPEARISARGGRLRIGARSTIAAGAIVQGTVTIGDDSSVQAYAVLVGYGKEPSPPGAITIGHFVRIAPHVMIIAAQHRFDDPTRPIHGQGMKHAPITIEDDVWIGGGAHIMAGVRIGRGSVIGAGAVVTKDIPPFSVAVGVPARVIRSRLATPPFPGYKEPDVMKPINPETTP